MALEQDILMAVAPNSDGVLRLKNQDSQYEDYDCAITNFKYVIYFSNIIYNSSMVNKVQK